MITHENITWCVAHTQAQKEWVAQQHLLDQGYEVYMPRFKKTVRHARKVEQKLVPLFPRYIFVGMDLESARWRSINGTRGVSYLLMRDDTHPAKVPDGLINHLRAQETEDGIFPLSSLDTFTKGETVRILDGPLTDHMAVFDFMDDKSRVHLLLSCMGREITVCLPVHAVEAA